MLTLEEYKNNNDVAINIDQKEVSALFNIFNASPDNTIKIFPKNVLITVADLFHLREKMNEKLELYLVQALVEGIEVRYENNKFESFSSWNQFENLNLNSSSIVESITLKWDFLLRVQNYGMPQRHTVVVRLSSGMKPEQLWQLMISGKIEDLDGIDKNLAPVICSVSFVNHLLSEEIVNIVKEWNKSLRLASDEASKFKFLKKNKMIIANSIKIFTKIVGVVLSALILCLVLNNFNIQQISDMTIRQGESFIIVCAFCYIINKLFSEVGYHLGRQFLDNILQHGDIFTFEITKGDKGQQEKIIRKNKRYEKSIRNGFITSLTFNIVAGVIATIIYNFVFS